MSNRGGAREGAGRKALQPQERRRRLSTTVSAQSWSCLQSLATQSGGTISDVLDQMLAIAATEPRVAALLAKDASWAAEAEALRSPGEWPYVLVVEDDPTCLELIKLRLEFMGCRVASADRVEDALLLASEVQPSLIIVDLVLHGEENAGLRLIHELRTQPATALVPIAIHSVSLCEPSGLPEPLPKVEALLPKPFKLKQLEDLVGSYCRAIEHDATSVAII